MSLPKQETKQLHCQQPQWCWSWNNLRDKKNQKRQHKGKTQDKEKGGKNNGSKATHQNSLSTQGKDSRRVLSPWWQKKEWNGYCEGFIPPSIPSSPVNYLVTKVHQPLELTLKILHIWKAIWLYPYRKNLIILACHTFQYDIERFVPSPDYLFIQVWSSSSCSANFIKNENLTEKKIQSVIKQENISSF